MEVWIHRKAKMFIGTVLLLTSLGNGLVDTQGVPNDINSLNPGTVTRNGPLQCKELRFLADQCNGYSSKVLNTRKYTLPKKCQKYLSKCDEDVKKCKKNCKKNKKCKSCCKKCKEITTITPSTPTKAPTTPEPTKSSTLTSKTVPTCPPTLEPTKCPTLTTTIPTCPTTSTGPPPGSLTTTSTTTGISINVSNASLTYIYSPGYRENKTYPDNSFYEWIFIAPTGEKVSFTMLDIETEYGYDIVKIYDEIEDNDEKAPVLATMSGDRSQQVVISTKEKMRVTFTSDAKTNMKGFKASAIAFNKTGCITGTQHFNLTDTKLTTITSPNYSENKTYSSNSFCEWIFIAPPGEKVSFTMLEMETEYGYDVVKIYDYVDDDVSKAPILATMSGNKSQQVVISTTEKMRVTFNSDINKNMKGFKASVIAFRKADIPKLEWIDLTNLKITFPNGVIETIQLNQISNVEKACIFKGKTNSTKVVITSKYSTSDKCQSLDQHMEISIISNNLKPNKAIYELKNGQLTQVDETIFEDNVVKGKRNVTSMVVENEELPKLIQIPIQFGYDRGLFNKFSLYGQEKIYIEKRIEEIFYHSKWSLQGMLKESNIELLLVKNIIFVNEVLSIDNHNLQNCRKYQRSEEVPLVILVEEDYNNNIKGLSFRSGACRKDNERYGVALISWREDGSLAGDVLAHELGHLIGGIHNAVNETRDPEHEAVDDKGEMYVGYSDFNYESVKFWFNSNGYRCFGKNCSSPPNAPNGYWKCDDAYQSCDLKCDNGFSSIFSHIKCENGNWSDSINLANCSPSVLFIAGGDQSGKDVEIYSEHDMTCSNKPPALDLVWDSHTSFYHQGTVYLCGGMQDTSTKCISINSKLNTWRSHTLTSAKKDHLSVVMRNTLYLIGAYDIVSTALPMTDTPDWSRVTTLSYKAIDFCVAKIDQENFVILGGSSSLRSATKYNVVSETTQPLAFLNHERKNHGCIAVEESGKTWIVVTGGYGTSAEKLDTSVEGREWQNLHGRLNVARSSHGMAVTEKGLVVVGGWKSLKSVELLDWESETWTLIEPIKKPRQSYGGLVEIPYHLFECQFATKGCSAPPETENGNWTCDTGFSSCFLRCDYGFVTPYHTTMTCNGGGWKNINEMECLPSVFLIGTEIYHPVVGQPTCSKSLPSTSAIYSMHTSFFYNDTIYLFGGYNTASIFESFNTQAARWEKHSFTMESRKYNYGHSSIVIQDTLYIIGAPGGVSTPMSTTLPLSTNNRWSSVPNLLYWGEYSCVIKLDDTSFVITGGNYVNIGGNVGNNEAVVLKYNVIEYNTITMPSLSHKRYLHGCAAMLEDDGKQWIIIGGGLDSNTLKTSQKLDVSSNENSWIDLGNLNVARSGFSMINTPRGIMALGGYTGSDTINSVELLDWTSSKWKEVEPSLAAPKNRYGGALEIPAPLLGCETLLSTVPDTCVSMCSSNEECSLVQDNLMTTLTKLAKEFFISYEYKATAYSGDSGDYQSMIHFTEDGDCCDVGKRIPGVWSHDGGRLHLTFSIDGNGNYYVDTVKYPVGQWHQAEFSQSLENGKYIYRVKINGENVVEVENKDPRIFSNVKVYAANPWHNSLEGSIRNLLINKEAPNKCGDHRSRQSIHIKRSNSDYSSRRSIHTRRSNSDCPIRPFKENGHWTCDATNTRCSLICDPGFASLYTDTICTQGIWQDVNEMECLESVLLVAGGHGMWNQVRKDVEIFDINSDKGNVTCSYKPPMLTLQWYMHTSFTYKGNMYLCGGYKTISTCICIDTQLNTRKIHTLVSQRYSHSSIVMRNKLYLVGGHSTTLGTLYYESVWTTLPLTDTPDWIPVVNLTYKGLDQCVVKIDQDNFVIIGGEYYGSDNKEVTKYNVVDGTTELLAQLKHPRTRHSCVVVEQSSKTWIVVTGRYRCGPYRNITCGDGEKLDISGANKTWETIGRLNVDRDGHGMATTAKGIIVLGGKNGSVVLKSVELLNWETGEWKLIEQSLTNGRYYYGGIMEIPAIWFGCPSQNITITGCSGEYDYNKAYDDGVLTEVPENGTCYFVCQNITECVGWTWTNNMECYITKTLETLQTQEGSISGLKNSCKPKCYLVLGEEEEASTSTQYCHGENTVTGCLNMIYMEPNEFHEGDKGRIYVCYKLEVPDGRGDIEEKRFCDLIDPENVDLICNPEPGIITLSTYQHINKYLYYGHNKPYFIWWRR